MATATTRPTLNISTTFTIDEGEARALDALAGYGDDAFIKVFYEKLGQAYMRDHEQSLRQFLKTIRSVVGPAIRQIDAARDGLLAAVKKDAATP